MWGTSGCEWIHVISLTFRGVGCPHLSTPVSSDAVRGGPPALVSSSGRREAASSPGCGRPQAVSGLRLESRELDLPHLLPGDLSHLQTLCAAFVGVSHPSSVPLAGLLRSLRQQAHGDPQRRVGAPPGAELLRPVGVVLPV